MADSYSGTRQSNKASAWNSMHLQCNCQANLKGSFYQKAIEVTCIKMTSKEKKKKQDYRYEATSGICRQPFWNGCGEYKTGTSTADKEFSKDLKNRNIRLSNRTFESKQEWDKGIESPYLQFNRMSYKPWTLSLPVNISNDCAVLSTSDRASKWSACK